MENIKRNILLNPGPATTTDTVKYAQVVPDICPRELEFCTLLESISNDLTKIAGGDDNYTTVLFGGSGTAVMDAAINSVVPYGKKIMVINNGAYGERMVKIAKAYQIDCVEMKYEVNQTPALNEIESTLDDDNEIECVAMVHHETTTGLLNPVKEIGEIVKKYNKVFIVDTISSFAGLPVNITEMNIDFMMSTSNKCIQGMAGAGFIICKLDALDKIKSYPRRSYYLSLYDQYDYFKNNKQMQFTPPVQTMYALRTAIDEFLNEGAENRFDRYTNNWKVLRKGLIELGFRLLLNEDQESHIILTVLEPDHPNYNFNAIHDSLYERGFTIYPGKVGRTGTFRIANIGEIFPHDIVAFLKNLESVLKELKIELTY